MYSIHKTDNRNARRRQCIARILAFVLFLGCLWIPKTEVQADNLKMKISASKVKIGKTVTATITVPAGVSATINLSYPQNLLEFSSASETANANGGTVVMTLGGYGGTDSVTTGTIRFTTKGAGEAMLVVSAPTAGNIEGDPVSLGGSSAVITIENEVEEEEKPAEKPEDTPTENSTEKPTEKPEEKPTEKPTETTNQDVTPVKSKDNSLSQLRISAGTLSPVFKYSVLQYSATVDYDVNSIVVSAKTSSDKAKIESVTGADHLSVGENKIRIVVRAENGVTATYTIVVTRKEKEKQPQVNEDTTNVDTSVEGYLLDGKRLYPTTAVPEDFAVDGFASSEITLWDKTYPALRDTFGKGDIYLIYLVNEAGKSGRIGLVMEQDPYTVHNFVSIQGTKGYIIILPDGRDVPEGYIEGMVSLPLEKPCQVNAWYLGDDREFPLIYGVTNEGVFGWYVLDVAQMTYIRYEGVNQGLVDSKVEEPEQPEQSVDTEKNDLQGGYSQDEVDRIQNKTFLILGGAVLVILILIVIIIALVIWGRGGYEYDDEDDEYDVDANTRYMMEAAKSSGRYDKTFYEDGPVRVEDLRVMPPRNTVERRKEDSSEPKEETVEETSEETNESLNEASEPGETLLTDQLADEVQRISTGEMQQELLMEEDLQEEDEDIKFLSI